MPELAPYDVKMYTLMTEGNMEGVESFHQTQLIYPKDSWIVEKRFESRITGIAVGARTFDERTYASLQAGGVTQTSIKLRITAGNSPSEAIVRIFTKY